MSFKDDDNILSKAGEAQIEKPKEELRDSEAQMLAIAAIAKVATEVKVAPVPVPAAVDVPKEKVVEQEMPEEILEPKPAPELI